MYNNSYSAVVRCFLLWEYSIVYSNSYHFSIRYISPIYHSANNYDLTRNKCDKCFRSNDDGDYGMNILCVLTIKNSTAFFILLNVLCNVVFLW